MGERRCSRTLVRVLVRRLLVRLVLLVRVRVLPGRAVQRRVVHIGGRPVALRAAHNHRPRLPVNGRLARLGAAQPTSGRWALAPEVRASCLSVGGRSSLEQQEAVQLEQLDEQPAEQRARQVVQSPHEQPGGHSNGVQLRSVRLRLGGLPVASLGEARRAWRAPEQRLALDEQHQEELQAEQLEEQPCGCSHLARLAELGRQQARVLAPLELAPSRLERPRGGSGRGAQLAVECGSLGVLGWAQLVAVGCEGVRVGQAEDEVSGGGLAAELVAGGA